MGEKALGELISQEIPTSTAGLTAKVLGWLDKATKRKTRDALARLGLTTNPDRAEAIVNEIMARAPARVTPSLVPCSGTCPLSRHRYRRPLLARIRRFCGRDNHAQIFVSELSKTIATT